MKRPLLRSFLSLVTCCFSAMMIQAQAGLCPPNLDFEMGDFTYWICKSGNGSSPGNVNTVTLTGMGPQFGRHAVISAANAGVDPYGGFPMICPNGSGYSIQLGNGSGGAQAELISYTYTIPSTLTTFSILFHYAVVLQDPNHLPSQQPEFHVRFYLYKPSNSVSQPE